MPRNPTNAERRARMPAGSDGSAGLAERLWTPADVSAFFCGEIAERTLANWRVARTGPPSLLIGRRPFYRPEAVKEWARKREVA